MRHELENVREILQKAANGARLYQENIAHVRRTCRPEMISQEIEPLAKFLNEAMEKAKTQTYEQLDALSATIKKKAKLDPQNYRADVVEFMRTMKPGAEDLEAIAKQFEGNETMLQFLHQYRTEQQLIAELPMTFTDKLKYVQRIRDDLGYALGLAGEPFDIEKNRYAHVLLQDWADNFDKVFADRIEAIGDF